LKNHQGRKEAVRPPENDLVVLGKKRGAPLFDRIGLLPGFGVYFGVWAISSASSPTLARLHGQRSWSDITRVAGVESRRSGVSLGHEMGAVPRVPGVDS